MSNNETGEEVSVFAFDFETTMDGPNRSPSHLDLANYSLCFAYTFATMSLTNPTATELLRSYYVTTAAWDKNGVNRHVYAIEHADVWAGHNLRFDLGYLKRMIDAFRPDLNWDKLIVGKTFWDTSIAHYVLTGQRDIFPDLRTALARYPGIGTKSTFLEEWLDYHAPKTTGDMNDEELLDLSKYCANDARITHNLAREQIKEAHERGMFPLIVSMGEALKAVASIENNGLQVYLPALDNLKANLTRELQMVHERIGSEVLGWSEWDCDQLHKEHFPKNSLGNVPLFQEALHIDIGQIVAGSTEITSKLLFGSKEPIIFKVPHCKLKNGNTSWAKVPITWSDPIPKIAADCGLELNKKGSCFLLDADALAAVATALSGATGPVVKHQNLIHYVLQARELSKTINTYLDAVPKYIKANNLLHPNINQTATVTGRFSSSAPNFQNMPRDGKVKGVYVPPEGRVFLEFDYKQLEVIAIAWLTGDVNLRADVTAGVDIHAQIGAKVHGRIPTNSERTHVKRVVFAMLYGSGAPNIAKTTGIPKATVDKIMAEFKHRYPGVFAHHRAMSGILAANYKSNPNGADVPYVTRTGRVYHVDVKSKVVPTGIAYEPAWTQLCNYPCQGLATADIVPTMLGVLYGKIVNEDWDVLLHNTVHDSVLVSVPKDQHMRYAKLITEVLENPYEPLEMIFDIDNFDLPLKVEASFGNSWGDMEPLDMRAVYSFN